MAIFLKIDDPQAFDYLKKVLYRVKGAVYADLNAHVDVADQVDHLCQVIEHPLIAEKVFIDDSSKAPRSSRDARPSSPPSQKKATRKVAPSQEAVADLPSLCSTHLTYRAVRSPRTECAQCWQAYERFNPTRISSARRKFERKQHELGQG